MTVTTELVERIWARDPTVWTGADEAQWLGWLDEPLHVEEQLGEISRYAESQHDAVDAVVLMGMGGSSLAPEVLRRTFGVDWFHVLDTTHPKAIRALEEKLDLSRTLFVSASGDARDALARRTSSVADSSPRSPTSPTSRFARENGFCVFSGGPTSEGATPRCRRSGSCPAVLMG